MYILNIIKYGMLHHSCSIINQIVANNAVTLFVIFARLVSRNDYLTGLSV
jgi:hypothetical protein